MNVYVKFFGIGVLVMALSSCVISGRMPSNKQLDVGVFSLKTKSNESVDIVRINRMGIGFYFGKLNGASVGYNSEITIACKSDKPPFLLSWPFIESWGFISYRQNSCGPLLIDTTRAGIFLKLGSEQGGFLAGYKKSIHTQSSLDDDLVCIDYNTADPMKAQVEILSKDEVIKALQKKDSPICER